MKLFNKKSDRAINHPILYLLGLLFIVLSVLIAGSRIMSTDPASVSNQLAEPTQISEPHHRINSPYRFDTNDSQRIRKYFSQQKSDPRVYSSELKEILDEFDRLEATRCHILKVTTPAGATNYYLKALPPSREEVASVRSLIAATLQKAPPDKKSMLDDSIGQLIKEYDPNGAYLRRLVVEISEKKRVENPAGWQLQT
jgi:hypothetical protein